jgi:uncharacterized membrane protein YdjX (TVP38/TMEM64 family)
MIAARAPGFLTAVKRTRRMHGRYHRAMPLPPLAPPPAPSRRPRVIAAAIIVLVSAAAAWYWLPVGEWIRAFQDHVRALGPWGVVLVALVFTACVVALVPGSVLSITVGLTYGLWGVPLAILGATAGACVAFLIGRHLARAPVYAWIERHPALYAVEQAINDEGWRVVALLRLNPLLPFNAQNYLLGVTRIPFTHYAVATLFGIAPGTAFDVYLGALGAKGGERGAAEWTLLIVGLAATALLVWLVGRKAKASLSRR